MLTSRRRTRRSRRGQSCPVLCQAASTGRLYRTDVATSPSPSRALYVELPPALGGRFSCSVSSEDLLNFPLSALGGLQRLAARDLTSLTENPCSCNLPLFFGAVLAGTQTRTLLQIVLWTNPQNTTYLPPTKGQDTKKLLTRNGRRIPASLLS